MECIYITDGSLEGLLCAIYEMYYSGNPAFDILYEPPVQINFAAVYKEIKTESNKAQRVYDAIIKQISHRCAEEMTYAWLSEMPFCGRQIARYIRLGFKMGYKVDQLMSNDIVIPVHKAAAKVRMEVHRLLGLCRFSKTVQDFYICEISPDHNVLTLLAPHFAARMKDMKWIIHDKSRGISAVYDTNQWFITDIPLPTGIQFCKDEYEYRKIWKSYFEIIAIEGRTNPKLQRSFVPIRYRQNLTEFQAVDL